MNLKNPVVSVIVPSYNHATYIEKCLLSILGQTYSDFELIVIDDGSPDHSAEVLNRLQAQYGFQLHFQKNVGVAVTANRAAKLARGEFLAFCASDDYWSADKLQLQVTAIQRNPAAALVYGMAVEVDDSGHEYARIGAAHSGMVFNDLMQTNFIPALTVMVRKSVFDELNGFPTDCYIEDYFMWLKIARKYPLESVDRVLAYYRVTVNFLSRNAIKMVEGERRIYDFFAADPLAQAHVWIWRARWFNTLALEHKGRALRILREVFGFPILAHSSFWHGVAKWFMTPKLKAALRSRSARRVDLPLSRGLA